jgi:hypothetical protein
MLAIQMALATQAIGNTKQTTTGWIEWTILATAGALPRSTPLHGGVEPPLAESPSDGVAF